MSTHKTTSIVVIQNKFREYFDKEKEFVKDSDIESLSKGISKLDDGQNPNFVRDFFKELEIKGTKASDLINSDGSISISTLRTITTTVQKSYIDSQNFVNQNENRQTAYEEVIQNIDFNQLSDNDIKVVFDNIEEVLPKMTFEEIEKLTDKAFWFVTDDAKEKIERRMKTISVSLKKQNGEELSEGEAAYHDENIDDLYEDLKKFAKDENLPFETEEDKEKVMKAYMCVLGQVAQIGIDLSKGMKVDLSSEQREALEKLGVSIDDKKLLNIKEKKYQELGDQIAAKENKGEYVDSETIDAQSLDEEALDEEFVIDDFDYEEEQQGITSGMEEIEIEHIITRQFDRIPDYADVLKEDKTNEFEVSEEIPDTNTTIPTMGQAPEEFTTGTATDSIAEMTKQPEDSSVDNSSMENKFEVKDGPLKKFFSRIFNRKHTPLLKDGNDPIPGNPTQRPIDLKEKRGLLERIADAYIDWRNNAKTAGEALKSIIVFRDNLEKRALPEPKINEPNKLVNNFNDLIASDEVKKNVTVVGQQAQQRQAAIAEGRIIPQPKIKDTNVKSDNGGPSIGE